MYLLPPPSLRAVEINLLNLVAVVVLLLYFEHSEWVFGLLDGHHILSPAIIIDVLILLTLVLLKVQVNLAIKADPERFLARSGVL
jgi:hypothetical protein